jgi:spore photoproduct lyase
MVTLKDISRIVCEKEDLDTPIVRSIVSGAPQAELILASDIDDAVRRLYSLRDSGVPSKKVVFASGFKGRLIQKCPGSPGVVCCGYKLVNTGFNCLYDCSYCFLNGYLNSYGILVFTNTDEIERQTAEWISESAGELIVRVGTGEFTDSLMIDSYTGLSGRLIGQFAAHRNMFLEIKTKSSNVDHLLGIKEKGNAVIAWSVNTQRNIYKHEPGSASLSERIDAAKKACGAGYFIAFHFDPVILYDGWEAEYRELVRMLLAAVDNTKILWISMGGVRFTKEYKDVVKSVGLDDEFILQEHVRCADGKFRYYKPIRRRVYRAILDEIAKSLTPPFAYMCMESPEMWDEVFGRENYSSELLERDFAEFLNRRVL